MDDAYLIYHEEYLTQNYLVNGLYIFKIFIILFITLMTIYMFYLNKYNIYFYNENHLTINVTKYLTLYLFTLYFLSILYLVYLVILYLYPFVLNVSTISIYLYLVLFLSYYLMFLILINEQRKHFILYFLPFILYFVTSISQEIDVDKKNVSGLSKGLYLLFYDFNLYDVIEPYYSIMYYISIMTVIGVYIVISYKKNDLIT